MLLIWHLTFGWTIHNIHILGPKPEAVSLATCVWYIYNTYISLLITLLFSNQAFSLSWVLLHEHFNNVVNIMIHRSRAQVLYTSKRRHTEYTVRNNINNPNISNISNTCIVTSSIPILIFFIFQSKTPFFYYPGPLFFVLK